MANSILNEYYASQEASQLATLRDIKIRDAQQQQELLGLKRQLETEMTQDQLSRLPQEREAYNFEQERAKHQMTQETIRMGLEMGGSGQDIIQSEIEKGNIPPTIQYTEKEIAGTGETRPAIFDSATEKVEDADFIFPQDEEKHLTYLSDVQKEREKHKAKPAKAPKSFRPSLLRSKETRKMVSNTETYKELDEDDQDSYISNITEVVNDISLRKGFKGTPEVRSELIKKITEIADEFVKGGATFLGIRLVDKSFDTEGFLAEIDRRIEEEEAGGTTDGPATPQTEEEFNALPDGSLFIDPDDGRLYRK